MPPRVDWVKDMNYHIVGTKKHWTERPWVDEKERPVHPMWRRNLSDNLLMNLFQTPGDPADKTKFVEYYGFDPIPGPDPQPTLLTIPQVLTKFSTRLAYVPVDTRFGKKYLDGAERASIPDRKRNKAKKILASAIRTASDPLIQNKHMVDLYLDTFYTERAPVKELLVEVLDDLRWFQETIKWICMPFLKYKIEDSTDDPGLDRPSEAQYRLHIYGSTAAVPIPGYPDAAIMGIGNSSFEDFLFYSGADQADTDRYFNARRFAAGYYFFDPEHVDERVERESLMAKALEMGEDTEPYEYKASNTILSNSNGYKCEMQGNVRKCVPGSPSDYCVNNGSGYCPNP